MWSDSSDNGSESELDYGVDEYMFEHSRSDDDTAGYVSRAEDSEEAIVVVVPTPHSVYTGFIRLHLNVHLLVTGRSGSIGYSTYRGVHAGNAPVQSVAFCWM